MVKLTRIPPDGVVIKGVIDIRSGTKRPKNVVCVKAHDFASGHALPQGTVLVKKVQLSKEQSKLLGPWAIKAAAAPHKVGILPKGYVFVRTVPMPGVGDQSESRLAVEMLDLPVMGSQPIRIPSIKVGIPIPVIPPQIIGKKG